MTADDWAFLCLMLATASVTAFLDAWVQRREARRQRIRAEEAEAWADEHQREAAVLAGDLAALRERHATLTELYGEAVRRLLASNYVFVHRNLEWKRQRGRQ